MASPAVQTTAESETTPAGTAHTVTLPASIAANDLLIVIFSHAAACTLNALAGWTELVDTNAANAEKILYRYADGTEGASISLTSSASTKSASIAYRISGAENPATQAPELSTVATGTSTTPNATTVTPTGGSKDYLFLTFAITEGEEADDDTWGGAAPSGFSNALYKTTAIAGAASTNCSLESSQQQLTAASLDAAAWSANAQSLAWRAWTMAIHPEAVVAASVAILTAASPLSAGEDPGGYFFTAPVEDHDYANPLPYQAEIALPPAATVDDFYIAATTQTEHAVLDEAFWPVADLIAEQCAADIANDTFMPPLFGIHFTLSNTNEGGTDGVTITTGNSGGGSGDAWTVIGAAVAPNAFKFASAQAGGTLASNIHYQGISDTISFGWNALAKRENRLWGRMYVWLSTYLIGNESRVFLLFYGGPPESGHTGIGLNAAGTLVLETVGGTNIDTSPTAIPLEKWARLEIMWERNQQNTGTVEWRLYFDPNSSTPDYSASFTNRNGGSGDYDSVEPFSITRGSGTFIDFYTDDMAVSTVGWLGPSGTTFVNNERPSIVANHYTGITPEFPYEYIDEAEEFVTSADISTLIPPVIAADDSYIATLDLPHDEIGGLYPDDLSDYQPAYDDAPHTLFNDGPLFPDDLVPTLSLPDDQAWIDPPYDYTNDQPLVDTALEALFSDGPVAVATPSDEIGEAWFVISSINVSEQGVRAPSGYVDEAGRRVFLITPEAVAAITDAELQAAGQIYIFGQPVDAEPYAIESYQHETTLDVSALTPSGAVNEVNFAQPLMWPDHEVYFPERDYTDETPFLDHVGEAFNDGPLFPDDLLGVLDISWDQAAFPEWDWTNDQPWIDTTIEAFLFPPTADDSYIASLDTPADLDWSTDEHDYYSDVYDETSTILFNDGPLFPDDLLATLDINWDQAAFPDWDYTSDQPIVDGAIEAFIAGPPLFITDDLIAIVSDSVTSDLEVLFPPWDYTNDQTYQDGAAEALLNDGPLFPDSLYPALDLPDQTDHTPADYTDDQTLVDGAFEAIVAGELALELFSLVSADDQTWAWVEEDQPPTFLDDALAAFLAAPVAFADDLIAALDLAHAMGEEFFPLDPPLVEYAELTPMAAIYGVPHPGPTALGPRSFYWGMRKTIQGFSPGSPRDQDVKLGHRPRRNS